MKLYKIIIIILIVFFITGFNDIDLLNENNPKWYVYSDEDGLPDALEEILRTNKYKKDTDGDKLSDEYEVKSNMNPFKKDLNRGLKYKLSDDYINENFELNEDTKVTEHMLLESADIVSKGINKSDIGKKIKEVYKKSYKSIENFKIIRFEDGSNGFGGIALKQGNTLIVAYKPTRSYRDWIENFTTQFMPHPQREYAIDFITPLVNKDIKIYITGHSLGGLLAQYATYELVNQDYNNVKTVTFNSANTFNPRHMKGEYGPPIIKKELVEDYGLAYLKLLPKKGEEYIIDMSYITKFLNKSIQYNGFIDTVKFKKSDFKNYKNIVKNYIISKDPLYLVIGGGYLGVSKIKEVDNIPLDIINDKDAFQNYHKLENFIDILDYDN